MVKGNVLYTPIVITCPPLAAPDHGSNDCLLEGEGYLPGELCLFKCDDGYKLGGSTSRICQDNGTWSGTTTTCTRGMMITIYYTAWEDQICCGVLHTALVATCML